MRLSHESVGWRIQHSEEASGCYGSNLGSFPGRIDRNLFVKTSRPALRLTMPPAQWVPGNKPRTKSSRGVKLTIHIHFVPRLRIGGAIPKLPHMPSMGSQGRVYLHGVICRHKTLFVATRDSQSRRNVVPVTCHCSVWHSGGMSALVLKMEVSDFFSYQANFNSEGKSPPNLGFSVLFPQL
jgi:hypothetical protein